jgi:DivIVA domain-containing protein
MTLMPADVHNIVFKNPANGRRGYDEDQVDGFLDVVEAELTRLIEQNDDLRCSRGDAVADEPPGAPAPAAPPAPADQPQDDSMRASRLLALATATGDRYVGEAKQQAEQMVASAQSTSEQMISEAAAKSEQMVSAARMRAHSMISDSRNRADTMEREAASKAAAHQEEERLHREVLGSLEEKRRSLEGKIAQLRTFEQEYRTFLRSNLDSHLRDLDSRGSAEPSSNTRQGQPLNA